MPLQRTSLLSFLRLAKSTLEAALQQSRPITFVVGNESADLDSLCSAILLAYLRTYSPFSASKTVHVPLSNLIGDDLSLRPELRPALSRARLQLGDLITLSDLRPSGQSNRIDPQKSRWILVDHNSLQGELGEVYSNQIVGVIDHHDEENKVPIDRGDEPRIILKSGSCASLVIEHCREAWDALSTKRSTDESIQWDTELANIALAPILIDTTNLKSASKVTPHDVDAVEYLESKVGGLSSLYDRDVYFSQLSSAKADIGNLSLLDIFRKDYKQWTEPSSMILGISSAVKPISFLLSKAGSKDAFIEAIHSFARDRKLAIFALMTTSTTESGEFRRELLLTTLDEGQHSASAVHAFTQSATETLGLVRWASGQGGEETRELKGDGLDQDQLWCWEQKNLGASRKQVGPLLRKAINGQQNIVP